MIGGGQEALIGLEPSVAVKGTLVRASLEQRHCKDTLYFFLIYFLYLMLFITYTSYTLYIFYYIYFVHFIANLLASYTPGG